MDLYKHLLRTKDHVDLTTVTGSAIRTKSVSVRQVLHQVEKIHETVNSELLKAVNDFNVRVDEQRSNIIAQMEEINPSDAPSAASQFITQLVSDYEAAKYESYWGRRYAAKGQGGVGLKTNDEDQPTSDVSVNQPPPKSFSPEPEHFQSVPEVATKQLLHHSSDDEIKTDFSFAASQLVTQLVGDYEAAKYQSYWGKRYSVTGRVGLETNDKAKTTSDVAVNQPPPESISPAPEQIRLVSDVVTKQLLHDSSDDRNQTNLSSAASQFVTQLVSDYEAAKYESYWGGRYAAKGRVGLGANDEAQTTSDAPVN